MEHIRFVNHAPPELQEGNRHPVDGYQHSPVLSLEKAIEKLIPLVPGIKDYAAEAKKHCVTNSPLFTIDESAAIYLYSMPIPLISRFNEDIRKSDSHAYEPWTDFLKLFLTAVDKLPPIQATVWRGAESDNSQAFANKNVHTWCAATSCSLSRDIVQPFVSQKGTLFAIDAIHAKDISSLSVFPNEQEVILMPGTRIRAKAQSHTHGERPVIVYLEEVAS